MASTSIAMEVEKCMNCAVYSWTQPRDKSALKRCTGCRYALYCSEQCQKEHWHNTHKKHCKYISKRKVLVNGKHDESFCKVCSEETKAGKDSVAVANSSVLPCTMSSANMRLTNLFMFDSVMGAIPLAEMTGNYLSKLDSTLAIALRILMKMKLANNILWSVEKSRAEELYKMLVDARFKACCFCMYAKPGSLPNQIKNHVPGGSHNLEITQAVHDINHSIIDLVRKDQSMLTQWAAFKVLVGFLAVSSYSMGRIIADMRMLEVKELPESIQMARLSSLDLNKMWENVLATLSRGLVPYNTLLDAILHNIPLQHCYGCGGEVTKVKKFVFIIGFFHLAVPTGVPFLLLSKSGSVYYLCGKILCSKKLLWPKKLELKQESLAMRDLRVVRLYGRLLSEYQAELCDYCGGFSKDVRAHRCAGCKSKLYCGTECYKMDTVHHTLCEKGDNRKRKNGNDVRKEKGRDRHDQFEREFAASVARIGLSQS